MYVAAYGDDFRSAGRRVFELFEKRGFWATIINDIVLGRVLTMGVLGVGLTSAVAGLFIGAALLGGFSSAAPLVVACFGGLVGLVLASVAMGAVDSAVAAVYVCFGEDPQVRVPCPARLHALLRHHCTRKMLFSALRPLLTWPGVTHQPPRRIRGALPGMVPALPPGCELRHRRLSNQTTPITPLSQVKVKVCSVFLRKESHM